MPGRERSKNMTRRGKDSTTFVALSRRFGADPEWVLAGGAHFRSRSDDPST